MAVVLPGDYEAMALRELAGIGNRPASPWEYVDSIPGVKCRLVAKLFEESGTFGMAVRPAAPQDDIRVELLLDYAIPAEILEYAVGLLIAGWYCNPLEAQWSMPPSAEDAEQRYKSDCGFARALHTLHALYITGDQMLPNSEQVEVAHRLSIPPQVMMARRALLASIA